MKIQRQKKKSNKEKKKIFFEKLTFPIEIRVNFWQLEYARPDLFFAFLLKLIPQ